MRTSSPPWPERPARICAVALGVATLLLTACAQTPVAAAHQTTVPRTGSVLGDSDPNPALNVNSGDTLDVKKGLLRSNKGG